jgi:hypothetical protein
VGFPGDSEVEFVNAPEIFDDSEECFGGGKSGFAFLGGKGGD